MGSLLEMVRTRARGMLGLGAVTGVVGYVLGVLWSVVSIAWIPGLLRDPELWQILSENAGYLVTSALWYGFRWAIPAALIGTTFGGILSLSDGKRRLSDLRLWKMGLMGAVLLVAAGCARHAAGPPLPVATQVDLERYMGQWHEIARYPNRFQEGCKDSRAHYTLLENGKVRVRNECERDGETDVAEGTAWVVDEETNAKLKVSFFWPFRGDYWILDVGRDYEYAVVSAPSREYLWILSRTPILPARTLVPVLDGLKRLGFDIEFADASQQQQQSGGAGQKQQNQKGGVDAALFFIGDLSIAARLQHQ